MEYLIMAREFFENPWVAHSVIFTFTMIFFYKTFQMGYNVDDNYIAHSAWNQRKSGKLGLKQKIHMLCFSAGFFNNALKEHVFTTILYAINACLIYRIGGEIPAFLFIITPVNSQLAIWLNGRRYAISLLCVLLVWNFKWLFLPLYAFATWLHVYAVALPVMMLFTDQWWQVPIGVGLMFIFGWKRLRDRYNVRQKEYSKDNELQKLRPGKIIFYIKSLGWYFFHTILPWKPRMYQDFLYYAGRTKEGNEDAYRINLEFWKGMAVVLYIGWEIIFNHNIWAVWWLVFISQYCNVITVLMNASDRYCTLAGVGLLMLMVEKINMIPTPFREAVYSSLITMYIIKYIPLFRAYRSIDDFHWYHILIDPEAPRPRLLLADIYLEQLHDSIRAFAIIKDGLKYKPKDFELVLKMAKILFSMKSWDACIKTMEIAKKYLPLGEEEEFLKAFSELQAEAEKRKPVKLNRSQRRATGR